MYCCLSNSASRRSSCSGVKMVRTRLPLPDDFRSEQPEHDKATTSTSLLLSSLFLSFLFLFFPFFLSFFIVLFFSVFGYYLKFYLLFSVFLCFRLFVRFLVVLLLFLSFFFLVHFSFICLPFALFVFLSFKRCFLSFLSLSHTVQIIFKPVLKKVQINVTLHVSVDPSHFFEKEKKSFINDSLSLSHARTHALMHRHTCECFSETIALTYLGSVSHLLLVFSSDYLFM